MINNFGKEETFWSLINQFNICIPIIQRDYVQGRNKDQVIDARQNLLNEMLEAIKTDRNLDLNFIYGKVRDWNGEKIFIPLDGQQRLTTLFLLHWYFFAKAHDFSKEHILKKFSYETRTSSRMFIENLVKNTELLADAANSSSQCMSKQIQNEAWFWNDWLFDPTIESMLIMLDEIKERFIGIQDLADKLTSGSSISFRFLKMDDLGMEDSLYIKLNARGKPLTDFENFKAELVKYVKRAALDGTLSNSISGKFATELDGKWTDLFWQWTSEDKENFDKIYMNCFHWMLWNRWAEKQSQIEKSNYKIISEMNRTAYYRLNSYRDNDAIDGKVLEDLYYTLDYFSNTSDYGIDYLKKCSLASGTAITYEDRVMLFSVTSFLGKNKNVVKSEAFGKWLRVLGNLSRNTRLDGLDDYVRAVQSIGVLTDHSLNLMNYLTSPDCKIGGFLNEQIDEERLKAKLILRDNSWATTIYDAEKHPYFSGQIAFLLSFAGLDLRTVDTLDDVTLNDCLKRFTVYKKKVSSLFDEKGLIVNADLLSRAILSKGDYLIPFRRCKSFLVVNHRDISWKTLLRNSNTRKRIFLKEVLDELDENDLSLKNIERKLNDIIDKDKTAVNDWRHYFIKMDGLLENCGNYRLIYPSSEGRILLLSSQTTAGYNKEYYTYVVYLKLLAQGKEPHYSPNRGQYGEIFIDQVNGKEIKVNYYSSQKNASGDLQITYNATNYTGNVDDTINCILTLI